MDAPPQPKKPKKVLIVTDDAGESFEVLYAQHRFAEAGFRPVIAATKKKMLHGVIHDFEPGWNTYIEKPGYRIESEVTFGEVNVSEYAAVVLIGGRAPEFLRHNDTLISIVREFARLERWVLSICHGIQILVAADLVDGRKVTCYCNVRSEATNAGGEWVDEECVVDGKLITAQTWESHADFYRAIFEEMAQDQ